MISRGEIVRPAFRVAQNSRDEQRQYGRNADRDDQVGAIAQCAYERPAQNCAELRPLVVPAKWETFPFGWSSGQGRDWFLAQRNLFDVLDPSKRFVPVPPPFRR